MGPLGASCFHTLSDDTRDLDKATWDQVRVGQVCTEAASFANWKAAILKLCKVTHGCTYEEKQRLITFVDRVEARARVARAGGE